MVLKQKTWTKTEITQAGSFDRCSTCQTFVKAITISKLTARASPLILRVSREPAGANLRPWYLYWRNSLLSDMMCAPCVSRRSYRDMASSWGTYRESAEGSHTRAATSAGTRAIAHSTPLKRARGWSNRRSHSSRCSERTSHCRR